MTQADLEKAVERLGRYGLRTDPGDTIIADSAMMTDLRTLLSAARDGVWVLREPAEANARDYERQVDRYWAGEADRAYDERKNDVAEALAANGGRVELWMRFSITPADLALLSAAQGGGDE